MGSRRTAAGSAVDTAQRGAKPARGAKTPPAGKDGKTTAKQRPAVKPLRGARRARAADPGDAAVPAAPGAGRSPAKQALVVALRAIALLVFAVCAAVVLKLTLTPSPASVGIAHTNLKPGATIRLYLNQASVRTALLQIGGNILIGAPFGLLLPAITPRFRGLLRVVLTTAVCVTVIELAQHFFVEGRSFDVDDIILAVVGAALAYLVFGRTLALRLHPTHRHWWQRRLDALRRRRA